MVSVESSDTEEKFKTELGVVFMPFVWTDVEKEKSHE